MLLQRFADDTGADPTLVVIQTPNEGPSSLPPEQSSVAAAVQQAAEMEAQSLAQAVAGLAAVQGELRQEHSQRMAELQAAIQETRAAGQDFTRLRDELAAVLQEEKERAEARNQSNSLTTPPAPKSLNKGLRPRMGR